MIKGLFDIILDDILEIVIQHIEATAKNQLIFDNINAKTVIKQYLSERLGI